MESKPSCPSPQPCETELHPTSSAASESLCPASFFTEHQFLRSSLKTLRTAVVEARLLAPQVWRQQGRLRVAKCTTDENLADPLTKFVAVIQAGCDFTLQCTARALTPTPSKKRHRPSSSARLQGLRCHGVAGRDGCFSVPFFMSCSSALVRRSHGDTKPTLPRVREGVLNTTVHNAPLSCLSSLPSRPPGMGEASDTVSAYSRVHMKMLPDCTSFRRRNAPQSGYGSLVIVVQHTGTHSNDPVVSVERSTHAAVHCTFMVEAKLERMLL